MNLELSLKTKFIILTNLIFFVCATFAQADPTIAGEILPPASAALIEDPDLIKKIAVGRDDEPVWCYSNDANAIIVSAPQRQREKCKLEFQLELERAKADCDFALERLNITIESLTDRHDKILSIKDNQIEKLTQAALKRPNDYSFWWATGGVAVGVLTTLAIVFAVNK